MFAVDPPFQERTGFVAPLFDLEVAESVLMTVAKDASQDNEAFSAQRSVPPAASAGELLVVSFDGTGVPMIQEEAVKLTAKLGTGASGSGRRQRWWGSATPSIPSRGRPKRSRSCWWIRRRRGRVGSGTGGATSPRAQQGRRGASVGRTKPAVMKGIKADAERRDPPHGKPWVVLRDGALGLWRLAPQLFKPWKRVTCGLDILHLVGYLWSAANALCGEASQAGKRWVQHKLTEILRGRVGDVIGGLRQLLTTQRRRQSRRATLAQVITCFHNHRRWMPTTCTWPRACPSGPASWSRPAGPW